MTRWRPFFTLATFAFMSGNASAEPNRLHSTDFTTEQNQAAATSYWPARDRCPRTGFFAGGSVYLLQPYFQNNTAFISTAGTNVGVVTSSTTEFDWNFQAAPAIWLGWAFGNGVAARARYFHFDHSSGISNASLTAAQTANGDSIRPPFTVPGGPQFGAPSTTLQGGVGQDNLAFRSGLAIAVIDAEASFEWLTGQWFFALSTGGRYLRLEQSYDATLTNPGGATETQQLSSVNHFRGGGPTVAAEARWDLGQSRWSLVGLARGSLLVGGIDKDVTFTDVSPGVFARSSQSSSSLTHLLPTTELELGVEYETQWRGANYFIRSAVVNQVYFNAGNASSQDGNLSLFGAQFSFGVDF